MKCRIMHSALRVTSIYNVNYQRQFFNMLAGCFLKYCKVVVCFHCTSHIHFNQAPKVNHLFMLNSNEHEIYQLLIIEFLILNGRVITASRSFKASKNEK